MGRPGPFARQHPGAAFYILSRNFALVTNFIDYVFEFNEFYQVLRLVLQHVFAFPKPRETGPHRLGWAASAVIISTMNIPVKSSQGDLCLRNNKLSILDCLPLEVLQEIFLQCLASRVPFVPQELLYHSLELQGCGPQTAPLLLCQVSQLWRRAALSLPRLWIALDVFVSMGKARPALPLVSLWLARSRTVPLSLSLHQQNESNANCLAAGEVLEMYKHHISHWGEIHLDLASPSYCKTPTPDQRAAPLLREFRLQIQGGGTGHHQEEEEHLYGIFQYVPRLSRLDLSRIPDLDLFGHTVIPLPWHQLSSLSLDYVPSITTVYHLLNKCPSLIEAAFKIDAIHASLPFDPVCHNLSSLTVNIGHEELPLFLEHVILPGLTDLKIFVRGPLEQYGWPQELFERFLKNSDCRILSFEIHDTGMRGHEFEKCLRNPYLQSMVELVVGDRRDWTWDPFVTDFAMDLLTSPTFSSKCQIVGLPEDSWGVGEDEDGGGDAEAESNLEMVCALPNLESLSFRGSCIWTKDGAIADMVESRWRFHCGEIRKIKHLEIEILSGNVEDRKRLKEFSGEGLDLDLSFR